eukprot:3580668-Rhodomonas_salina.2
MLIVILEHKCLKDLVDEKCVCPNYLRIRARNVLVRRDNKLVISDVKSLFTTELMALNTQAYHDQIVNEGTELQQRGGSNRVSKTVKRRLTGRSLASGVTHIETRQTKRKRKEQEEEKGGEAAALYDLVGLVPGNRDGDEYCDVAKRDVKGEGAGIFVTRDFAAGEYVVKYRGRDQVSKLDGMDGSWLIERSVGPDMVADPACLTRTTL